MADVANAESLTEQASGSVGNATFGRNQHGPWVRPRGIPADPNTVFQQAVRAAMAQCVTAWNSTLTQPQRDTWDRYALALRQLSPIGRRTNAGGLGMYVRSNVPRIQAAVGAAPRVDVAPTRFANPAMEPLNRVVLNIVDDTLLAYVVPDQQWLNQLNGALLFYASRPQPLTVNFFRGPYRYAGKIIGQPLGPSYTPFTFPCPFPAAINERVFIRTRQTRADASLGASVYLPADHVPQVAPTPVSAQFLPALPRKCRVTFTDIIRPEPHATANWQLWYNNQRWTITVIQDQFDPTDYLTLLLAGRVFDPHADEVHFTPPPDDVYGINTGIPVAPFVQPVTL